MDLKFQEGNRVFRWHRPDRNGLGLMTALIDSMTTRGAATVLTGTRADKVLTDDGRVCGVRAIHMKTGDTTEMDKGDFNRVLRDHPQFAQSILEACRERYQMTVTPDQAFGP